MHTLILIAATDPAVPNGPGLRPGLTEEQVTPGLLGFLVTFFIVVIMVFLIRDMVKRIRRVRYREQLVAAEVGTGEAPQASGHMGIPMMSEAAMREASYTFDDDFPAPGKAAPGPGTK